MGVYRDVCRVWEYYRKHGNSEARKTSIDIEMVLTKGDQGLGYTSLYNPHIVPTGYSIIPWWFPLSFPFPYISQSLQPKALKPET